MSEPSATDLYPTTIFRDTRERRPWSFQGCDVETRDVTLSTGDYTLPAHCAHDSTVDTYHPQFAIERKSGHDFLNACTWERDRFTTQLQRAAEWDQPLAVVVEESWKTLLCKRGTLAWRDVHPNQIAGTVSAWHHHYNVTFHFAEDRLRAQRCALVLLVQHTLVRRLEAVTRGQR